VTPDPDFDELMSDAEQGERERLRRVHDMLIVAGPPPELTPQMEAGPTLAMTIGGHGSRRHVQRRVALLAAAIVVLLLAFLVGYITGNDNKVGGQVLKLQGTAAAPNAQASLRVEDVDPAGNWPMELAALGLPKLPPKSYYEVFLVRNGKPWAPCGTFVVKNEKVGVSIRLNAPYRLRPNDTWIVTRQTWGVRGPGPTVLEPLT
jgi:hypothetical protein